MRAFRTDAYSKQKVRLCKFVISLALATSLIGPAPQVLAAAPTSDQIERLKKIVPDFSEVVENSKPDEAKIDAETRRYLTRWNRNSAWNSTNPKWNSVYGGLKNDLTTDRNSLLKIFALRVQPIVEKELLSEITQEEAGQIVAFYESPAGRAKKDVMNRFNKMEHDLRKRRVPRGSGNAVNDESISNLDAYVDMAKICFADKNALLSGFFIDKSAERASNAAAKQTYEPIIRAFPQEAESLYKQYGDQLPAINAFIQTQPGKDYAKAEYAITVQLLAEVLKIHADTAEKEQKDVQKWKSVVENIQP